jgi:hypothetical protein
VSSSIYEVAATVAATLRSYPDLDIIVADNLEDRPYHRVGATIYINSTLAVAPATRALLAALNDLRNDTSLERADDADTATVLPLEKPPRTPDDQ